MLIRITSTLLYAFTSSPTRVRPCKRKSLRTQSTRAIRKCSRSSSPSRTSNVRCGFISTTPMHSVPRSSVNIRTRALRLLNNPFASNLHPQGETEMKLTEVRKPLTIWLQLSDSRNNCTNWGDLMFSLSYLPTAER